MRIASWSWKQAASSSKGRTSICWRATAPTRRSWPDSCRAKSAPAEPSVRRLAARRGPGELAKETTYGGENARALGLLRLSDDLAAVRGVPRLVRRARSGLVPEARDGCDLGARGAAPAGAASPGPVPPRGPRSHRHCVARAGGARPTLAG